MAEDRYVFIVEWYDTAAALVRTYNFTYFLKDNTIEMVSQYPYFSSISKTEEYSSGDASSQGSPLKISSSGQP